MNWKASPTLFLSCLALPCVVYAQTANTGIIVPGDSAGGVKLTSTFATFQTAFPSHPNTDVDTQNNGQTSCPTRTYHWVDVEKSAVGVYAFFVANQISQLSIQTPRLSLAGGQQIDSSYEDVKAAYPAGQEYLLIGSGRALAGGNDLVYWVDMTRGIAFELYWNSDKQKRLVGAIDIFAVGANYLPGGCIAPSLSWNQVR